MKRTLSVFLALTLISSCSFRGYTRHRRVPAQSEAEVFSSNLLESTARVREQLSVKSMSVDVCTHEIKDGFNFLAQIPSNYFKINYNWIQFKTVIDGLWDIKQSLRRHVQNWQDQGVMTRECSFSIRAAYRATRYIEDNVALIYLNQRGHKITGFEVDDMTPSFGKGYPWTKSNPGIDGKETFDFKRDLQSGDLLLWRGKSPISASIARLGDSETNFSHVSIVYKEPKTGRLFNIESLIETGLIYNEFTKTALDPGSPRIVVLRYKDKDIAARAGRFAYETAKRTMNTDEHLFYDFGFDLRDHHTVFCSEVVNWAFKEASDGDIDLPSFKTHFNMKNRRFLNAIGTDVHIAFQPGDVELTSGFKMIAEWRDFKFSKANQLRDIIHSNFYRWMDEYNYNFKWNMQNIIGTLAYGVRRTPLLSKLIASKLPLNMPRKTLTNVLSMEKVSNIVFKELKKRLFKKNPHAVYSLAALEREIEAIRVEDLERYKDQIRANHNGEAYPNPKFHHLFGPPKKDIKKDIKL